MKYALKILSICCLGILPALISCTKNETNVIKEIDTEILFYNCIPDFSQIFERQWAWELDTLTEYLLERTADSANLRLKLRLYSNHEEATNWLDYYVNDASANMSEGHPDGLTIGDEFYWWSSSPGAMISHIMFTRHNAFFMMNCREYDELDAFALCVDREILRRASYIDFAD